MLRLARLLGVFGTAMMVLGASASAQTFKVSKKRKTSDEDLSLTLDRFTLENGLIVLLSPDPNAQSVLVDLTFMAGARFEPPHRSGLAHLVEHVVFRGPTPRTDYLSLLERRGAHDVGAFTTPGRMIFRTVVPPEELPLALWVHTDRIANLPGLLPDIDLDRHRAVVEVERAQRVLDIPYGKIDYTIYAKLFPPPHPLRAQVIGQPDDLARATKQDVKAFIERYLVPNNAVLTIVGNFDKDVAENWVRRTVARLPRTQTTNAAPLPPPPKQKARVYKFREEMSRKPRVTMLWKFEELGAQTTDWLHFGALLLSSYLDGAFGTQLSARLVKHTGGLFFRLDVTLPYDKPIRAAKDEAEVFLRYLTAIDVPTDLFNGTRLAYDRLAMFSLDTLEGRAAFVMELQRDPRLLLNDATRATELGQHNSRHWSYRRHDIQHSAWKNLIRGPPRIIVHARPVDPKQPKLDWEDRL